ncbi:MAG: 4Fe-4S dicluster domain-containing protein [Candidatus Hydrothermarchaeota archaeon]
MKVYLYFPPRVVGEPIISSVIIETGKRINILRADINSSHGEIVADIEGREDEVNEIIEKLRDRGVEVSVLERVIEKDDDICVDCGACISLCPVNAIYIDKEWKVVVEGDKCIGCKTCVDACPVRAISMTEAY